jgi:hypothetical protein
MQGLQASEAVRLLPISRAVVPRWGLPVSGAVWFPQGCNEWFWEGLMGFGQLEVEFLLHEHRYQPFVGEALSIGKQAVALKPEAMLNLLKAYGIEPKNTSFEVDTKNGHNLPGSGWITDESFFASFRNANYSRLTSQIMRARTSFSTFAAKSPRAYRPVRLFDGWRITR